VKVIGRMTGPRDAVPRSFSVSSLGPRTFVDNSCQSRPRRVEFRAQYAAARAYINADALIQLGAARANAEQRPSAYKEVVEQFIVLLFQNFL